MDISKLKPIYLPKLKEYCDEHLTYSSESKSYVCPFHEDSNPSLSIESKKFKFKCFGCGAGGDYFDMRAYNEGISLKDLFAKLSEETDFSKPVKKFTPPAREILRIPMLHRRWTEIHPDSLEYLKSKKLQIQDIGNAGLDSNGKIVVLSVNNSCAQEITTRGKFNRRGSIIKGAYHIVGTKEYSCGYALCEGWATAVTIHKISHFIGVFCYGFSNIQNVADIFKGKNFFCFPDRDKNTADLPNKITFSERLPGSDWNDAYCFSQEKTALLLLESYVHLCTERGGLNSLSPKEKALIVQSRKLLDAEVITDITGYLEKPTRKLDDDTLQNLKQDEPYPSKEFLVLRKRLIVDQEGFPQNAPLTSFYEGNYSMVLVTGLTGELHAVIIRELRRNLSYTVPLEDGIPEKQRFTGLYYRMKADGIMKDMSLKMFENEMTRLPLAMLHRFVVKLDKGWQVIKTVFVYWIDKESYVCKQLELPYGKRVFGSHMPAWARELLESGNPFFFFLFCHIGFYAYKKYQAFLKDEKFQGGHVVHFVGGSGTGKTTLCSLWNKLLGKTDFLQMDNTEKSIAMLLEENEELFLDETESVSGDFEKFAQKICYQVSAGATRGRYNRRAKYFACTLVSTGERAMVTESSQAGTQRRALQLFCDERFMCKSDCAKYMQVSTTEQLKETIVEEIPNLEVVSIGFKHKKLHPDLVEKVNEVVSYGKAVCEQVFGINVGEKVLKDLKGIFLTQDAHSLPTEITEMGGEGEKLTLEEIKIIVDISEIYRKNRRLLPSGVEFNEIHYKDRLYNRHILGWIDTEREKGAAVYLKSGLFRGLKKGIGKEIFIKRMIALTEKGIFLPNCGYDPEKKGYAQIDLPHRSFGRFNGIGILQSTLDHFE